MRWWYVTSITTNAMTTLIFIQNMGVTKIVSIGERNMIDHTCIIDLSERKYQTNYQPLPTPTFIWSSTSSLGHSDDTVKILKMGYLK